MLDFTESGKNFNIMNNLITVGEEGRIFGFKVNGHGGLFAAELRESLKLFLEMRGCSLSVIKEQLDIFDTTVATTLRFKEIKNFQELIH